MRVLAVFKYLPVVIALSCSTGMTTACAWASAEMTPKRVNTGQSITESQAIDGQLLATADAILAEGVPLKADAARRHSTTFVRADDSGRIQAYVYCERDRCEPIGDALMDAGGRVEQIRIRDARPVIQAWIPAGYLRATARLGGVEAIAAPHYAQSR